MKLFAFTLLTFLVGLGQVTALPAGGHQELEERSTGSFNGIATYFYQYGNPGACGNWNSDSAWLVALRPEFYNNGKNCGHKVHFKAGNGKELTAIVQDECPGCNKDSVDMSIGFWNAFGYPSDDGIFDITW
ncbi:hypothetical protein M231_04348 [Tremella mesenterica]|uniref:Barwin domain-containing protein n=1 Tax=Tremella mesenterica TaxID=5217 RepID=A0A4Q1BKY7_TREME|nr:hypothetical protein M231_04348 [Tremella mesenterica]